MPATAIGPEIIIDLAKGTAGGILVLSFFILAFIRGWVIPGIVYEDLKHDRNYWRSVADRALTAAERFVEPLTDRGRS